jgi:tetratricopeptide (TPR) repeat protein
MYSVREASEILGLGESRLRYWAQTGFVGPSLRKGGKALYSFQDLVGLRAAKELLDHGLSVQAVRRSLEALKGQLPEVAQPLSSLRVRSDGERLVVSDAARSFEALSGQLLLDFEVAALEARATEVRALATPEPARARVETAYGWFADGLSLEADPATEDQALIAYQKAIDADPTLAAAHTNLGALHYRRGALAEARAAFATALAYDPAQPEARFNLANLHEDLGERERALLEWLRVVAECPEFADAHYNLALALADEGAGPRAKHHLERYLALTGDATDPAEAPFVAHARALVARL